MDTRVVSMGLAGVRLGVGGALVVAPRFCTEVWLGPDPGGPGTHVLARALGARDVVLGYRTLRAARQGDPVGGWLQIGALADAADAVAGLVAMASVGGHRRITMPLVAAASGLACLWVARLSEGDAQQVAEDEVADSTAGPGKYEPDAGQAGGHERRAAASSDRSNPADTEQDELDDEAAARLLDVTLDRLTVMIDEGLLEPVDGGERRFRRGDVLAVRSVGG